MNVVLLKAPDLMSGAFFMLAVKILVHFRIEYFDKVSGIIQNITMFSLNTNKSDRRYGRMRCKSRKSCKSRGKCDQSRGKRQHYQYKVLSLPRDDGDLYGIPPPPCRVTVLLDRLEIADFHIVEIVLREIFLQEFERMIFWAREQLKLCCDCWDVLLHTDIGKYKDMKDRTLCRSCYLDYYDF